MSKRVVITSMGAVTAAGYGLTPLWDSVQNGKSMIGRLNGKGLSNYIGAQVDDAILDGYDGIDRATALALIASEEALKKSHLAKKKYEGVSVFAGSSKGGILSLIGAIEKIRDYGAKSIESGIIRKCSYTMPAEVIARQFGFGGIRMAVTSSCATGIHSIIMGAKFIREGRGDIVLAGATEASITPLMLAAYDSMGVLSHDTSKPECAMKPFDRKRDGFAIGEGAGMLLIESLNSARQRGAEIIAEIAGWSFGCDTYGLTALNPDGNAISEQIDIALKNANIKPSDIGYINAHGTATIQNDLAEIKGIKRIYGDCLKSIYINSTKPVTGHLIGATGAVETIITAFAIRDSVIPPAVNLNEPDSNFSGLLFGNKMIVGKKIEYAITMNFGFGGHIGVMVLAKHI